jgi:Fic family protein
MGREVVHFEGPAADRVDAEMRVFLEWLNHDKGVDLVLKAAIAHLWFVTIHPFEDGNGRIGRAIVDYLLARSEKTNQRFYSLSSQIQKERKQYYAVLEKTQKGGLDITAWIEWFFACLERAIEGSLSTLEKVVSKRNFWKAHGDVELNGRQRKILNRLLDGLEGKLTTTKWAKMARCSQDTAYRDITDLMAQGILVKGPEGGRSTSYLLVDLSHGV